MKKKLVIIALTLLALTGCTRSDEATKVLKANGYTDITITGWRPFMAGKDEAFSTGFQAKSPSGTVVTGAVTSGFLKGSTIRFD